MKTGAAVAERIIIDAVASLAKRTGLPPLEALAKIQETLPRVHWVGCWKHRDHHACAVDRITELEDQLTSLEVEFERRYLA